MTREKFETELRALVKTASLDFDLLEISDVFHRVLSEETYKVVQRMRDVEDLVRDAEETPQIFT